MVGEEEFFAGLILVFFVTKLFVSSVTTTGPRRRRNFFRFYSAQRHSITTATLNRYNIVDATHVLHSTHVTNKQIVTK